MWQVGLSGNPGDLSTLSQTFESGEIVVRAEGDRYVLLADSFETLNDPGAVHAKAEELVLAFNAAAVLLFGSTETIQVGAVTNVHAYGHRDIHVTVEPATIHIRGYAASLEVRRADGRVERHSAADSAKSWPRLVASDSAVNLVLRLVAAGDLEWVNLYRVYEVIAKDVGGEKSLSTRGWASSKDLTLFRHTANSPVSTGVRARHGVQTNAPPKTPMNLSRARELIRRLVVGWLASK